MRTTIEKNRYTATFLMEHQIEILEALEKGARYVVAKPRTGKTRPVIQFVCDFERVLVLTKKAAIGGWLSEMKEMGVEGSGWLVTNYEKIRGKSYGEIEKVEWDALVLDEAHSLGKYPKPNLCVKGIWGLKAGVRIGISATPCAESYSQLFHQAKALRLNLWKDEKNFYSWHRKYGESDLIRANGRMLETYKKCKDVVWEDFSGVCAVVDRQEAMPSFVEAEDVVVELEGDEVLEMCDELRREGLLEIDGKIILGDTPMAVAQKSAQMCCGAVLDDQGEVVRVWEGKFDWISRFKGVKTAILTAYKAEATIILEKYPDVEITDDFERFRAMGDSGWFVGSWQRFARGVDLSSAEALVITCCPWSAEGLEQGRDRILNRARTDRAQVFFPVIKGGVDAMIYSVVAGEKRDFTARQYERARHSKEDH